MREFERLPPGGAALASSDVMTFMNGAMEAFREIGLLSAARAQELREEFAQPFVEMGFVTPVSMSASSGLVATGRTREGETPPRGTRPLESRVERVIAAGQDSVSSDGRRVLVVSIICWDVALEIDVIEFVPDAQQRTRRDPLFRRDPFKWDVRDDGGRVYNVTGFGGHGGGGRERSMLRLTPSLSAQASELTITPPEWRGDPVRVPLRT